MPRALCLALGKRSSWVEGGTKEASLGHGEVEAQEAADGDMFMPVGTDGRVGAAAFAGCEVGWLADELWEVVGRLRDRVVGPLDEEILVAFAGLLVGIVGDARGMGQEVVGRDLR